MPAECFKLLANGSMQPILGVGGTGTIPPTDPPPDPDPDPGTDPDPAKWGVAPIWDEQFTGTSLDSTKWNNVDSSSANNNAYWRAANIEVSGGTMKIKSYNTPFGGKNYQSGNIQTYGIGGQPFKWCTPNQFFRCEHRSRNPVYMGFWPAPIWFRRIVLSTGFTTDGEIDVYEGYGAQTPNFRSQITLWPDYTSGDGTSQSTKQIPFSALTNTNAYDWHTWTMEKIPGRIDVWLDGVLNASWTSNELSWWNARFETPGYGWAARSTMQIEYLNSQGVYGGGTGIPDATTDWSQPNSTMELDYFKVWNYIGPGHQ